MARLSGLDEYGNGIPAKGHRSRTFQMWPKPLPIYAKQVTHYQTLSSLLSLTYNVLMDNQILATSEFFKAHQRYCNLQHLNFWSSHWTRKTIKTRRCHFTFRETKTRTGGKHFWLFLFLSEKMYKKNFQFKTACNSDTAYITQLKQQKSKRCYYFCSTLP